MTEVSLKRGDKQFLIKLFSAHEYETTAIRELMSRFHPRSTHHPNTLFARYSDVEIETILDSLTNQFVSIGLNPDSEPNAIGLLIEDYIDIFNVI